MDCGARLVVGDGHLDQSARAAPPLTLAPATDPAVVATAVCRASPSKAQLTMKLAVVITARPSYARVQTALEALIARGIECDVICAGSALLERYGRVADVIRSHGFAVTECWSTFEGATLLTSVLETGALCASLGAHLATGQYDGVVAIADRHEVLAVAQAASYQHIPLIHLQGGECSGSIDNRVRHAITQLADVHLVATARARMVVYGQTGSEAIHVTGCPSVDLALRALDLPDVTVDELGGSGFPIDLDRSFVIWLQHPVTTEMDLAERHAIATATALEPLGTQVLAFWPGEEAGAEVFSKIIRLHQHQWHTVRNLPPDRFLNLLTRCDCLVGNSSVGIRECSALGVPVVNIGTRQYGRERGPNVLDVPYQADAIKAAIDRQSRGPFYEPSVLYGDGHAGERIADVMTQWKDSC